MKTTRVLAGAIGLALALAQIPGTAFAAERPSDGSAIQAVEHVVGTSSARSAEVTLPSKANEAVRLHGTNAGAQVQIQPELSGSRTAVTSAGTTVVSDQKRTVAIQSEPQGVRLMSVLSDASSPTSTSFDVSLTADESLLLDPLGGVVLLQSGHAVGRFNAPWAVDASGRSLPTQYTLTGNTITQTVDTAGAEFPVVADPHYTWGWVTGTVYFNVSETEKMAASAAFAAAMLAFLPPPFDFFGAGAAAYLSLRSAWAMADHTCIAIQSPAYIHEYSGSQGDGYCR